MPAMRIRPHVRDANETAGKSALRSLNGVYAFWCWIACPTSCAAIATEATECPS